MRSRTSRGVPEWSGGKELYMGSRVSAIGKVSGVTGIVPGPPEGSQGSTGWGHLSWRAHGLKWEGNQPLVGSCAPLGPPAPRVGNLGVGAPPLALGGKPPPWPPPPWGPYIKRRGGRATAPDTWRLPSPLLHLSLPQTLGEALPGSLLHPPPCRRAAGSSSTSPSPLLDQEGGDVMLIVRVLNAEVPSVRR